MREREEGRGDLKMKAHSQRLPPSEALAPVRGAAISLGSPHPAGVLPLPSCLREGWLCLWV